MNAAKNQNDIDMIARLNEVPNKDLVAYDARYHRGKCCLSQYLNKIPDENIETVLSDAQDDNDGVNMMDTDLSDNGFPGTVDTDFDGTNHETDTSYNQ